MKKVIVLFAILIIPGIFQACGPRNHKQDNPDNAPMFRPLHHSKDTANA